MSAYPTRIHFADACRIIRDVAGARVEFEHLAVNRAGNRILADDLIAPISLPPFDNSRMDGFACAHASLQADEPTWLRLAGEQFAGPVLERRIDAGECVRITTGAPLPPGTDTVVIKEDAREQDGQMQMPAGIRPGADIRRQGDDVSVGDPVIARGHVLTPARLALAASLGVASLSVARRPTVAVFTSGDELVEPGRPLAPGQIYNGNRDLLMSLLRAEGLEPTAWPNLPDDPARMAVALADAAAAFDVVITCGGVSAGEKDHVPALLAEHGRIHFWKVRMKPGMPVLFGEMDRALLLCLPGNPVSALATFVSLGRPLLDALQGRRETRPAWRAQLQSGWRKTHDRLEFLRGHLQPGVDGTLRVLPNPADASHQLRAAADSNALIMLPEPPRDYVAGDVVEILPC